MNTNYDGPTSQQQPNTCSLGTPSPQDVMSSGRDRDRKIAYMSHYNSRADVKRRAREREQTPKYKAMRKLYRDKQRALRQGLTPSQIAARIELGIDLLS